MKKIYTLLLSAFFLSSSMGQRLDWVKQFGGAVMSMGSISVDANNSVYATGTFDLTIDFNPNGGVSNLTSKGGGDAYLLKLGFRRELQLGETIWLNI